MYQVIISDGLHTQAKAFATLERARAMAQHYIAKQAEMDGSVTPVGDDEWEVYDEQYGELTMSIEKA